MPLGTPSAEEVYLTIYPSSRPNANTLYVQSCMVHPTVKKNMMLHYIILNNGILKSNSSGVPSGFPLGNSFRQRVIFDRISVVSSQYGYSTESVPRREKGSTGKYQNEFEGVPEGVARGNSRDRKLVFSGTPRLESRNRHYPIIKVLAIAIAIGMSRETRRGRPH